MEGIEQISVTEPHPIIPGVFAYWYAPTGRYQIWDSRTGAGIPLFVDLDDHDTLRAFRWIRANPGRVGDLHWLDWMNSNARTFEPELRGPVVHLFVEIFNRVPDDLAPSWDKSYRQWLATQKEVA